MDRVENEFLPHAAADHHRPPIDMNRPIGCTTPQHHAVPHGRSFARIERRTQRRVNAIGAYQHVAFRIERAATLTLLEPSHHPVPPIGK